MNRPNLKGCDYSPSKLLEDYMLYADDQEQQINELKESNDKDCKYHLEVENQLQDEIIKLKQDIRSAVAKY